MLTQPVSPRHRGFSLIELLVVMAIMATLAGMGSAGYVRARNVSTRMYCLNNLRQLYFPMQDYVDTTAEKTYPNISNLPTPNPQNYPTLRQLLDPAGTNGGIFHCPMDTVYFNQCGSSYEYNASKVAMKSYQQLVNKKKPVNPSTIILMYDFTSVHGSSATNHGVNMLYLDGSAHN